MSILALVLAATSSASHLAVLELDTQGLSPAEKKGLTEVFTEEVARHFGGKVYAKHEIQEMLLREERVQRLEECDDRGCYVEIALALGAELMIEGSIVRMGEGVTMTVSLIDTHDTLIASRASLEWRGPTEGLADAVRALAQRLMIAKDRRAPGAVLFSAETPGAALAIDGKTIGVSPLGQISGLEVGVHDLLARADGHRPLARSFIVLHQRDTVLDLRLEAEEEPPLYAKWWLWAIVGAGAIGAASAVAIASSSGGIERPPSGTVEVTWSSRPGR